MGTVVEKKDKPANITVEKKLKDYSKDPVFRKKAGDSSRFLKKNGLPESFRKKNK